MEICSYVEECRKFNEKRFDTCYNPGWLIDNEKKCLTRDSMLKSQIPETFEDIGTEERCLSRRTKKSFVEEIFKLGCTLADGIQKLMIAFPGTGFEKAENYVWNYFYEKRRADKVEGDKTGVVCIK